MAVTPPADWENITPIHGIRYPKPTAPARQLPAAFEHIASDLDALAYVPGGGPAPVNAVARYLFSTVAERDTWTAANLGALIIGDLATGWMTPPVMYRWNGISWRPWESDVHLYTASYSPTNAGSGGTKTYQFWFSGGEMVVQFAIVFGDGAAVPPEGITFSIPDGYTFQAIGGVYAVIGGGSARNDVGGGQVSPISMARYGSSPNVLMALAEKVDGGYTILANTNLLVPVVMAVGGGFAGTARVRVNPA